jgi:hypothetical protein
MARSEEGGDLPIRKYTTGEYHIEGDLVLASKERLFMYFKNCINIFKLLEKLVGCLLPVATATVPIHYLLLLTRQADLRT